MLSKKATTGILSILLIILIPLGFATAAPAAPAPFKTAPDEYVCLTIDDGFNEDVLEVELDLLRLKNVKCTFFIIGCQLQRFPELWRQAITDGHEICYHTMYHRSVADMSNTRILADFEAWNNAAHEVLGKDYLIPKFARLPGGHGSSNKRILKLFDSIGYKIICWSGDTYTGAVKKKIPVKKYIMSTTKPGSIILTHVNSYDVPAMKNYIDWLSSNFKLARISDAFAPPPAATPPPWPEHIPFPSGIPCFAADWYLYRLPGPAQNMPDEPVPAMPYTVTGRVDDPESRELLK